MTNACSSCLQDIIGARFHCAVCPSVDICSNCESAGLPGNLDSSDDGHNSSHIMIKVCSSLIFVMRRSDLLWQIPHPLPSEELQSASLRAQQLWKRDTANIDEKSGSRRNSLYSSYARTVMGSASTTDTSTNGSLAHGIRCKRCNLVSITDVSQGLWLTFSWLRSLLLVSVTNVLIARRNPRPTASYVRKHRKGLTMLTSPALVCWMRGTFICGT